MPAHPFSRFTPFDSSFFLFTGHHWLTAITFVVVSAVTLHRAAHNRRREEPPGLAARVVSALPAEQWWALPILVWALQTSRSTHRQFFSHHGWFPVFQLDQAFFNFLSLAILVLVQSIAVALTGKSPLSLGVEGRARTAVHFALMAVVLDTFFCIAFGVNWYPN